MKAGYIVNTPKSSIGWFVIILLFFLFSGYAGAAQPNQLQNLQDKNSEYLIGYGDVLEISVWNEPDLSRTVFVRVDGRISLPLLGDIVAAGKTPEALATYLEQEAKKYIEDPNVAVIVTTSNSKRYYMVGQITNPGEYPMDYPITLLQAIAKAGGFKEWAKTSKILVIRRQSGVEKILTFNYDSLTKGEDLSQNILIVPGDTIIIP